MAIATHIMQYRHKSVMNGRGSFVLARACAGDSKIVFRLAIVWIASAVAVYLVAVYSVFGLGVAVQEKTAVAKELAESNKILELDLQQKYTQFARNNEEILQTMEKISDLKYVLPADTSVSRADIIMHANQ